jgi:hypothetical protein
MTVSFRRIGAICAAGIACVVIAYWCDRSFWLHKTAVIIPAAPEEEVMQTGTITTNGWEFKIINVVDFGRRSARHLEFCPRTRQIFVAFGDREDDAIFQWDIDTGRLVRTLHMGKGFIPYDYALSPDGHYLIAERLDVKPEIGRVPAHESRIIDAQNGRIVRDLGDVGCWVTCRFDQDGKSFWLDARTLENWDKGVAFALDGTAIKNAPTNDPLARERNGLWAIGLSKDNTTKYGLFYRDSSGLTNLITRDNWGGNYAMTKDRRVVLVATWHDDIVLWDAEAHRQIAKQRITNHHNGAGYVIYDEAKDRFLIADPSWQGDKHLRALVITKRPASGPAQRQNSMR